MAALTKERETTHERQGRERTVGVATNAVIFAGAGVVANASGYAAPAGTAGLTLGRAEESVDNTGGANGAKSVRVRAGCFPFGNSAGADEIKATDVEKDCYWVDDQTVALTDGTSTRSRAGKVFAVDGEGVWVDTLR